MRWIWVDGKKCLGKDDDEVGGRSVNTDGGCIGLFFRNAVTFKIFIFSFAWPYFSHFLGISPNFIKSRMIPINIKPRYVVCV